MVIIWLVFFRRFKKYNMRMIGACPFLFELTCKIKKNLLWACTIVVKFMLIRIFFHNIIIKKDNLSKKKYNSHLS